MCVGHSLENSQALCCKIVETEIFEARTGPDGRRRGKGSASNLLFRVDSLPMWIRHLAAVYLRPLAAVLLAAAAALFKGGMDMIRDGTHGDTEPQITNRGRSELIGRVLFRMNWQI